MKLESKVFEDTVLLKGLDGLLEIIGGIILLIIKPESVNRLASFLTQHELSQDPKDFIANHLLHSAQHFTQGGRWFAALYLLSHGVIKIVLVAGLLKKQLWAYPGSIAFLLIFMVYQIYRITLTHSISLTLLTIFDAFVLWLVWREYQRLIHHQDFKT